MPNGYTYMSMAGSSASVLTGQVTSQLTQLLPLRSCSFQYGIAGIGRPARLHHDGSVTLGHQALDVDAEGFPARTDIELLVESGGIFQGWFLMTPAPGGRPMLDQRLLAVALADQVGAALATSQPVDQSRPKGSPPAEQVDPERAENALHPFPAEESMPENA